MADWEEIDPNDSRWKRYGRRLKEGYEYIPKGAQKAFSNPDGFVQRQRRRLGQGKEYVKGRGKQAARAAGGAFVSASQATTQTIKKTPHFINPLKAHKRGGNFWIVWALIITFLDNRWFDWTFRTLPPFNGFKIDALLQTDILGILTSLAFIVIALGYYGYKVSKGHKTFGSVIAFMFTILFIARTNSFARMATVNNGILVGGIFILLFIVLAFAFWFRKHHSFEDIADPEDFSALVLIFVITFFLLNPSWISAVLQGAGGGLWGAISTVRVLLHFIFILGFGFFYLYQVEDKKHIVHYVMVAFLLFDFFGQQFYQSFAITKYIPFLLLGVVWCVKVYEPENSLPMWIFFIIIAVILMEFGYTNYRDTVEFELIQPTDSEKTIFEQLRTNARNFWERALEGATGGYYQADVEENRYEPLGVYITEERLIQPRFFSDEPVTLFGTITSKTLSDAVFVDFSCYKFSSNDDDRVKANVILPEEPFGIFDLEEVPFECTFDTKNLYDLREKKSIFDNKDKLEDKRKDLVKELEKLQKKRDEGEDVSREIEEVEEDIKEIDDLFERVKNSLGGEDEIEGAIDRLDEQAFEAGTRDVTLSASFNFLTNAHHKAYFINRDRQRAMLREGIDPFAEYGITEREPITTFTNGPVKLALDIQELIPVGGSSANVPSLLAIQIENRGQVLDIEGNVIGAFEGQIKEIDELVVLLPPGLVMPGEDAGRDCRPVRFREYGQEDCGASCTKNSEACFELCGEDDACRDECDVTLQRCNEECSTLFESVQGEPYNGYALDIDELKKRSDDYKNIDRHRVFSCRVAVEKENEILGNNPFATRFLRARSRYTYEHTKTVSVEIENRDFDVLGDIIEIDSVEKAEDIPIGFGSVIRSSSSGREIFDPNSIDYVAGFEEEYAELFDKRSGGKVGREVFDAILSFARERDINVPFVFAIIEQESGWEPDAIGGADDVGLMQVTPIALEDIRRIGLVKNYDFLNERFDPVRNVEFGIKYLSMFKTTYATINGEEWRPTLENLARGYNGGPSALINDDGSYRTTKADRLRNVQKYSVGVLSKYSDILEDFDEIVDERAILLATEEVEDLEEASAS